MIRTGIFGASGYTGIELVKILAHHPEVEIAFCTSESSAGQSLRDLFASAPYHPAATAPLVASEAAPLETIDVALLCLPHAAAAETGLRCLNAGIRVIDLSADFRLKNVNTYESWYKTHHPAPELLADAVYGLTEYARADLPGARLVAVPGCYPTSVLMPLLPLVQAGALGGPIIADSKSGVSGAGRKPKQNTHFVEVADNFSAYSIGRAHRHLPEMEEVLHRANPNTPELIFSPHLLPVPRGILSTIYAPLAAGWDLPQVRDLLHARYANEPFVHLLPAGELASLAHVVHTNHVTIGLTAAGTTLIITSALDNLVKGAAGQAVQNLNVVFGCPETTALL